MLKPPIAPILFGERRVETHALLTSGHVVHRAYLCGVLAILNLVCQRYPEMYKKFYDIVHPEIKSTSSLSNSEVKRLKKQGLIDRNSVVSSRIRTIIVYATKVEGDKIFIINPEASADTQRKLFTPSPS